MNSIIERQEPLQDGFTKRQLVHYNSTLMNAYLPVYVVVSDKDGVSIEVDRDNFDIGSGTGGSIKDERYGFQNLPNFVHDFTFGQLSALTDVPFHSVFGKRRDGFDHLSPDAIFRTAAGSHFIVEFTTFRGGEGGCRKAAQNKLIKYEVACESRSASNRIGLFVIAVHRDGVWSNLMLEEEEVNELVYRFRTAIDVFEELKRRYPELSGDNDELTRAESELRGIVSSIKMDWSRTEESFPSFKREVIESFKTFIPNEEYLSKIITKTIEKAQTDLVRESFAGMMENPLERMDRNLQECEEALEKSLAPYYTGREFRPLNKCKSTVQIPAWVTIPGEPGKSLDTLSELSVEGDSIMASIWSKIVYEAQLGSIERMIDDPEAELEMALEGKIDRPDLRNKYHRVKIELSTSESVYIASLGVGGKKLKDNPIVREARDQSKLPFSLYHNTRDLESFLRDDKQDMFEHEMGLYSPLTDDLSLRNLAAEIHQPTLIKREGSNEIINAHRCFMESQIGSWTQMVSLIGAELSASVKQHVKPGYFVIKRLLGSAIYLLIKPTCSRSHIFVSFAVEKSKVIYMLSESHVFRQYEDAGDLLVTDFVSYKLSKLTNLCKTNSLVEASFFFWSECYGLNVWEAQDFLTNGNPSSKEVSFMTKLSMLTLLEDKATTEEMQTMLRYVMMEGFVSQPEIPKPHKMCKKFPKVLRSELQVLIMNKVVDSILRISKGAFTLQKREGRISWMGMFNPFTGRTTKELQVVISCCYNGYFKNKEEETEPSSLSALYKKIIELEDQRPVTDEFLGAGDPESPNMHEFSRSYLKKVCDHGKLLLSRVYGQSFRDQIESSIMREINSITLERLATLKATSNFGESWYTFKEVKDKSYSRDRLLVKMANFAKEGKTLAIEKFEDCMTEIEMRGAMHICLFKKQQHGGLREIYVLGAEERIVQAVVEAIARSIGRFFHSDTLCNPANKMRIPESHGRRARTYCKGPVWTTATSDDARKWNQGHFVTKFAMMLCEFTHPRWHPIIIRGCSMFTNKYMMMNLQYLSILDGRRELDIEDDFVRDLFEGYHGNKELPWIRPGCTYLRTTTGMMQGILHYTSSLLHTLHQEFIRTLSFRIFDMKVKGDMSSRIVVDMMQGSDDSAMLCSFPSSDDVLLSRCKVAATMCFRVKKLLGLYLAIYPSEKSTQNTDFVLEYNSEFFFHSQHIRPTIRWVAASCSLPEVETLVARQEEASNLMTSISEGGGTFSLSAMIQQCQCTLHYLLMGMGMSELFNEYKKAIQKWRDPGLGFFLLDNPFCAGLGGFRHNLYNAVTRTNLGKVYAFYLRKVVQRSDDEEFNDEERCSVSAGGAIVLSSSLKWGSRKKFLQLRNRLEIPSDWIEQINENPEVLYRAPKTGNEIILRISEKLHSPGVVSSLSTGNAVAKVVASSVYFLSAAIFEDTGKPEYRPFNESRYSLLQRMMKYEVYEEGDTVTNEDLIFLFPNVEDLAQLNIIVHDKRRIEITRRQGGREATQTRIVVFDTQQTRASPEKLVSDRWFATQKSKIGRTGFELEWAKLKQVVRWLEDCPSDTLTRSPLLNHIQIKNFFARMEIRPRTVRVTGAPVKKRSGLSKLSVVIRDNFCRNGFVKGIEDVSGAHRSMWAELIKHLLFCVLQGPFSNDMKLQLIQKTLHDTPSIEIKESDGKTKTNMIAIMQRYMQGDKSTLDIIEQVGAGVVGGFVVRQRTKFVQGKVNYYGFGVWRGVMDGVQIQVDVDNEIGQPTNIIAVHMVRSNVGPWELMRTLKAWADDMGIRNYDDVSRGSRKGASYWMHQFKLTASNLTFGAPVYMVESRMEALWEKEEEILSFSLNRSTVNISIANESGGRRMNILSYTAGDGDLSPEVLDILPTTETCNVMRHYTGRLINSWVYCRELELRDIKRLAKLYEGEGSQSLLDMDKMKEIVKTCTETSLKAKVGATFSNAVQQDDLDPNFDMSAIVEMMIEDTAKETFSSIVRELEDDLKINYDDAEFDKEDIELFGPSHYREVTNLAMVSHPLMDGFVDYLVEKMGRRDLRKVISTGVVSEKNLDKAKLLYLFLGRDISTLEIETSEDELQSDSDSEGFI
ncbi:RNA-dependent RNA polymerase [Corfou virus]|uniref:RNA-directed RNA polymerase L n=2 Tax=Corfou virus TaxID=206376 RepID=A0A1U6ZHF7_9VIRU|nr:RNA-dependent RNA polymerase [Corfou virus]ALS88200.1 RNA-dependent RNA polymerase [Corfou virus]